MYERQGATGRPSPLQNRVTATGEIIADPARGLLMGNRGCLHRPDGRLGVTRWRAKLWICCTLTWKDIRRDPMPPGRWTALFFLDEVTSLAAGHRPCAYCRWKDFLWYAQAWRDAAGLPKRPWAHEMDAALHRERVHSYSRRQVTRPAGVDDLPDGVVVRPPGGEPALLAGGRLRPWTITGYGRPVKITPGATVELLTPPSSVAAIRAGYRPLVHPSAGRVDGLRQFD